MSWDPKSYLATKSDVEIIRLRNELRAANGVLTVTYNNETHLITADQMQAERWRRFAPPGLETSAPAPQVRGWDPIAYLKGLHTRALMSLRNDCHKFRGECDVLDNHSPCVVTLQQVLDELNTREHVPAKKERTLLRRLMAQNRMTEQQVRAVPKYATMLALAQDRRVVSAETLAMYKREAPHSWVTKKMVVQPA